MKQGEGQFGQTRWTTVIKAGQPDSPDFETALLRLCEDYRPPILRFAAGLAGSREDAEDLTQGFFTHLIKNNLPSAASQSKGRFRTFLLTAFKNYRVSEWRKSVREKDIPHALITSVHEETEDGRPLVEPVSEDAQERQMDILWAQSIRDRVIKQMARDYAGTKHALFFKRLGCLLLGREPQKSYEELGLELGMSENLIKQNVFRLRKEFREAFRAEVAETVLNPKELDEECRHLSSMLLIPAEEP